jgi:hypothetical protein
VHTDAGGIPHPLFTSICIDSEPDYSTHSSRDNNIFLRQTVYNRGKGMGTINSVWEA